MGSQTRAESTSRSVVGVLNLSRVIGMRPPSPQGRTHSHARHPFWIEWSLGSRGGGIRPLRHRLCGSSSRRRWLLGLLLLGRFTSRAGIALSAVGRRPQSQVVPQELHDQRAVTVRLFGERVEFGDGIVKGLLREVARTVRRVQDLVVEDGEVQRETESDRVCRGELGLRNIGRGLAGSAQGFGGGSGARRVRKAKQRSHLVRLVRGGRGNFALLSRSKLGQVSVVVTLPILDVNNGPGELAL